MRAFSKESPFFAVSGLVGGIIIPLILSAAVRGLLYIWDVGLSYPHRIWLLIGCGAFGIFWLIVNWFFCPDDVA